MSFLKLWATIVGATIMVLASSEVIFITTEYVIKKTDKFIGRNEMIFRALIYFILGTFFIAGIIYLFSLLEVGYVL